MSQRLIQKYLNPFYEDLRGNQLDDFLRGFVVYYRHIIHEWIVSVGSYRITYTDLGAESMWPQ